MDIGKIKINEGNIATCLLKSSFFENRYEFSLPNCYIQHDNECDVFSIRKSGYCDEFEIKISKSDFNADFKKTVHVPNPEYIPHAERGELQKIKMDEAGVENWSKLPFYLPSIKKPKYDAIRNGNLCNYFHYVTPSGLIDKKEIPHGFGLIEVDEYGYCKEVLQAELQHKEKLSADNKYQIARKAHFRLLKQRKIDRSS